MDKDQYDFTPISLVYIVPPPKICPLTIVLRDWDGSLSHNSNISLRVRKEIRNNNTISYDILSEESMLTNKKGEATFPIITAQNVTNVNFQVIISFHDSDCKFIISGKILNATKGGEIWVSFPSEKNGRYLIDKKKALI